MLGGLTYRELKIFQAPLEKAKNDFRATTEQTVFCFTPNRHVILKHADMNAEQIWVWNMTFDRGFVLDVGNSWGEKKSLCKS